MLAIRMQRTGRKGHPEFRIIVQESALSPSSGRVVARLGHHNPHTKETILDTEKASFYLENGAQPSERVVKLFKDQKVKLPKWVTELDTKREGKIRNPEKLRRNQPEAEEEESAPEAETPAEEEPAPEVEPAAEVDPAETGAREAQPGSESDDSTTAEKPAE